LGYGFNDDHLQTHLEHHLKKGKPAVLITRSLSDKARGLVAECDGLLAITADRGSPGSVVISGGKSHLVAVHAPLP
jgi:hypothetical protein